MVKVNNPSPVSAFQVYSKVPISKKIKKKKHLAKKPKKLEHFDEDVIEIKEREREELVVNIPKSIQKEEKKKSKKRRRVINDDESKSPVPPHQTNGSKHPSHRSPGKDRHKVVTTENDGSKRPSHRSPGKDRHKVVTTVNDGSKRPSHRSPGKDRHKVDTSENDHKSGDGQGMEMPPEELTPVNSIERGKSFLANLIAPVTVEEFMDKYWEKRPLVVNRNKPDYFSRLDLTTGSLDAMLRNNNLRFTKNIDITSYVDGKRETHNPEGRALPAEVWDFYNNEGCSVRWLNPQTYSTRLCALCSALQEYFGCFVGANIYLTPPSTQGFAPHYDDIEAFILQLEGRKHWRLYKPIHPREVLPRFSSGNFTPEQIGQPFLEVTLEAGDVLYFPRGVIHQAVASDSHSLHVTLSCYQRNSWADLLEQLLPAALGRAISEEPELRAGLPIGHLNHVGVANAGLSTNERSEFMEMTRDMVVRVLNHLNVDNGVDKLAKRFMEDSLPPVLTDVEKKCSVFEDGDRMLSDGQLVNLWEMNDQTMIKLTRAHCVRLVFEEGEHRLYHTLDNTREYHEETPGFFLLVPKMVPCVKALVRAYPDFIPVGNLPLNSLEEKVEFAAHLWQKGVLLTKFPLAQEETNDGE